MDRCGEVIDLYKYACVVLSVLLLASEGLGLAKSLSSHSILAVIRDILIAIRGKK